MGGIEVGNPWSMECMNNTNSFIRGGILECFYSMHGRVGEGM